MSSLDRTSHLPLARQIATALQYRIATGRIRAGSLLPSYRAAALEWGVNLHTVRRAYLALATAGLVRIDDRRGAVVLGDHGHLAPNALDQFAREVLETAAGRFGANGPAVIAALERQVAGRVDVPPVWTLECSWTLARAMAEQIGGHWSVKAQGWLSTRAGEVPPGTLITTYFHFDELRQLLPSRSEDLEVVPVRPALTLLDTLRTRLANREARRLVLLDSKTVFAHGMAPELRHYLGSQVDIEVRHPKSVLRASRAGPGELFLVSPRDWDRLGPSLRRRPRFHLLEYDVSTDDLARIAQRRGWTRQTKLVKG